MTTKDIISKISSVKHPAINYSLLELGIVKDVELNDNIVTAVFAFPFPNIPIADQLIKSISLPIEALGVDFKYLIVVMSEEEKAKFLQMETEAWIG